jgi:hypothetical protein
MAYGNGNKGTGESRKFSNKRYARSMKRYSTLYSNLTSSRGAAKVKTSGDRSYVNQTISFRVGSPYFVYRSSRYALKAIESFQVYRGALQIIFKR